MIGDAIASVIGKVIDRAWPDPTQRAAAAQALAELQQAGEFKKLDADLAAMQMQADVNKAEASSSDPFTSRWRPCVGYVCAAGLAYAAILEPLVRVIAPIVGYVGQLPAVDTAITMQILIGLLGLGGMRTVEKTRGAA